MTTNDFKNVSLNGRIAFGVSCFEKTLLFLNYKVEDWTIVLECLWEFADAQFLDEWFYKLSEIIPEYLLEFRTYEEHDFEYIDKHSFKYLYKLYKDISPLIDFMMKSIYNIASSHAYTIIIEYGQRSLEELEILINFMNENQIPMPDIKPFLEFHIRENKGYGNKFKGKNLSILLNDKDI